MNNKCSVNRGNCIIYMNTTTWNWTEKITYECFLTIYVLYKKLAFFSMLKND